MSTNTAQSALDVYSEYEAVIGIETHVQLKTKTKMFCGCKNEFGNAPNSNICPICSGQPGSLPVLNRKVVDFAILAGLATNCTISKLSEFARKHYMYPDLPKNFQTTQDDKPICKYGSVPIKLKDSSIKNIPLTRIHMEEDAGKNIHASSHESWVDLNRAGTPLLEIVTEPEISNAYEAKAYLMELRSIMQYLGISDANMEEGSFRADTNISVRKRDSKTLGTRVELKNINSFKFIGQAIEYELKRQIETIEDGSSITQETRLWDAKNNKTIPMRSKENAQDYRYFTEPDIPAIMVNDQWIAKLRESLPELPHTRKSRFESEYDLTSDEADVLVAEKNVADFFENATKRCNKPKLVSNWVARDILGYLKDHKCTLSSLRITPTTLAELITIIDKGIINSKVAQSVLSEMIETGKYPSIIVQEKNLKQIDSKEELAAILKEIIHENPKSVVKYRTGNEKLLMFFVGQAMKATKGKANPAILQQLAKELLSS